MTLSILSAVRSSHFFRSTAGYMGVADYLSYRIVLRAITRLNILRYVIYRPCLIYDDMKHDYLRFK